jgi:hypothetical protein
MRLDFNDHSFSSSSSVIALRAAFGLTTSPASPSKNNVSFLSAILTSPSFLVSSTDWDALADPPIT